MDLKAIQAALREADLGGWLFYDFHHRDPMAYRILGLDMSVMTSRRWFYWVPANGEPVKLAHQVEPGRLGPLPGRTIHYREWTKMHEHPETMLKGAGRVAMQY